jgi:hypothetical protein
VSSGGRRWAAAARASAPPPPALVFHLPFLHPRNPRSRSTCFGASLVEVDDGRRSLDSCHLWSDLHSPPLDLLAGCSSALWSPWRVNLGCRGVAPSVSRLACVCGLRPRPPTSLLRSPACCWRALVGRGAEAKAMTATLVGAANLLGGVTLLPPSLPLTLAYSPGANVDCLVGWRWRRWRHSPSWRRHWGAPLRLGGTCGHRLLLRTLLLRPPRFMLTIVFVTYTSSPLLRGCVAATVVLVSLSERMLCRSARVVWVDALPPLLGGCLATVCLDGCFAVLVVCLGGCFATVVLLWQMLYRLGRLLRWMLCHLVVSELL